MRSTEIGIGNWNASCFSSVSSYQMQIGLCYLLFHCSPPHKIFRMIILNFVVTFSFYVFMFLEPLTSGEYPESMIKLVGSRLPLFSTEESKLVKGSYDFLGLKYYTATYVKSESNSHGLEVSYITDPQVTYTSKCIKKVSA